MLLSERFFDLLVSSLVVFGISYNLAETTGPFGLFKSFRESVSRRFPQEWVKGGVHCPICVSFWVSLPVSLLFEPSMSFVLWWFAQVGFVSLAMVLSPPGEGD